MTSVLSAITSNNVRVLKVLLKVPKSIPVRELELGFLQASKLGHSDCVECFINTGVVDVETRDASGNTALYLCVQNNRSAVLEILVMAKASVNFIGSSNNYPLHVAAQFGFEKCLEILIKNGAQLNVRDSAGNSPLIMASKSFHLSIMSTLINSGCDVNLQNFEGCTALHYSCHKAMGVNILLAAGADPNLKDKDDITPLLMAATEGFDGVVRSLIESNCDVNIPNKSVGRTALHILTIKGHTASIEDLISGGGDINQYDLQKHTPLWYAIKNKRYDIIKLLLKANYMVDSFKCPQYVDGEACPTRLAIAQNMIDVVKLFILTGFDKDHVRLCLSDAETQEVLKTQYKDIHHWLEHAQDVMTLKQTCRKWIRHHLGRHFYHDLFSLPIPAAMRDFIFMTEIDEEH